MNCRFVSHCLLRLVGAALTLVPLHRVRCDDEIGLQAPEGFDVQLFAGDELASDIYSMTIDSLGRVVVSGRGYVRILEDSNGDGIADLFRQFADGPSKGSMGMFWEGRDLICTGDEGVLRYRDTNGDDRADGPPHVLVKARTGGEHDIHAIRKGPDGWWYLLGGNNAQLDERYVTLITSPVRKPQQGAMVRLSPDFSRSEVITDGFRNPYDFAFNSAGRLFTYDSDGERDISLPWYRPTRVFELLPGASAGWLSRSWKRPGYFLDMPPVVAAFGRGSPTGVECYRHTQFPEEYQDGLFVLDWTYGRVMFVPPVDEHGTPIREPEEFLSGVGSFGFAPTDAAVGPDGSLYVSVGGRGTRGSVYRVRWNGEDGTWPEGSALEQCLRAPQPLSSWSRVRWEPLVEELTQMDFQEASLNELLLTAERVRAIEILCEHFGGLDTETVAALLQSPVAAVRARTAWMLGRQADPSSISVLATHLTDSDVTVVRAILESLLNSLPLADRGTAPNFDPLTLLLTLDVEHRAVRQATARVLARLDAESFARLAEATSLDEVRLRIPLAYARILRGGGDRHEAMEELVHLAEQEPAADERLNIVRLLQMALGDPGPGSHPPVFDGYSTAEDLSFDPSLKESILQAAQPLLGKGSGTVDHEVLRLIAILQPDDPALLANVLGRITDGSHPTEDVHALIVAARIPAERSVEQTDQIARELLAIDTKVEERGLHRDLNWDDRMREMFDALSGHDPRLPRHVVDRPEFGEPGHITYAERLRGDLREQASEAFLRQISQDAAYGWTSEIIRFLGQSSTEEVRDLLRSQADNFGVRAAVLSELAQDPRPVDRALFVAGLDSPDVSVLRRMLVALGALGPQDSPAEQVALVRTLRRLGDDRAERQLQDVILQILQASTEFSPEGPADEIDAEEARRELIAAWSAWARQQYPEEWASQAGVSLTETRELEELLDGIDWSAGSQQRGQDLFRKRSCHQCHGGRRALGPDLSGVARRFSRRDLFVAIAQPNRDVSPRYQTTLIATDDGELHSGIVIYESIDGLLLRNTLGQTLRIESAGIAARRSQPTSLMPSGLLKDLSGENLADLYAYLKSLDR